MPVGLAKSVRIPARYPELLRIHRDPDPDKGLTEDEWINAGLNEGMNELEALI